MKHRVIIPAILTHSSKAFFSQVDMLGTSAHCIHVDVMDGLFVSAKSFSLQSIQNRRPHVSLEAHLMVQKPGAYISACARAGIKRVFFHIETVKRPLLLIERIRQNAMQPGIAIHPATPLSSVYAYTPFVNAVLTLGVYPGKQGQQFLSRTLAKIRTLASHVSSVTHIEADGGVTHENIQSIVQAGACDIVIGSHIWNSSSPRMTLVRFRKMLQGA